MMPFERFEQETQQLMAKHTEELNRDVRRVRLILNVIIIANLLVGIGVPIILLWFGRTP